MPTPRHHRCGPLFVVLVALGLGLFSHVTVESADADPVERPERIVPAALAAKAETARPEGLPADDRARGQVWAGLHPGSPSGPCRELYEVRAAFGVTCTHGPDAPPEGAEVTSPQPLSTATATPTLPCIGTGSDGNRVQAVYARPADAPDRFDSVASTIQSAAARVDQVFVDSAAETGGRRNVRWVTDGACNLVIERVQLSTAGDDTFTNTQSELQGLGLNRTDRKYLIWMDSTVYCGIASIRGDDQAGQANLNNRGPSYARVDSGCWGFANPVEAHELMHTLGGIQWSAPHRSMYWHCSDEWDRMCYQDEASVVMTYSCPSSHERLFDCNHDDYFHTDPSAGSYLATHWNSAASSFLVDPSAQPPPPTTTSTTSSPTTIPPTTTTTVAPSMTTTSYSGSLNRKLPSRAYGVTTGAGTITVTVSFTKASSLTVTVLGPDSTVVAQTSGPSARKLTVPVNGGGYQIVVSSGGATASYTATVSHPG